MNTAEESRTRTPEAVVELGRMSVETRGAGFGVEPTGIGKLELDGISEE